jgi:hypothetical protein
MRLMLVAALASTCGCDQIFGINGTKLADAPPGIDGAANPDVPLGTLFLTQLQLVTPGGSPLNDILSKDAAISPAPTIEIGTLTGALTPAAYAADGTFQVPFSLAGQPYRIVYQVPGDIPTEIQWSRSSAQLTVPLWGPVDRGTVPANADIHFAPTGAPANPNGNASASSTGGWATGPADYTLAGTADWSYSTQATAMGGPLAALTSAAGDYELLLVRNLTSPFAATGYAWQQVAQLQANGMATAASTWATAPSTTVMWDPQTIPVFDRLSNDGFDTGATQYFVGSFGGLASAAMPAFTQPPANGGPDGTVAIELANLVNSVASPITFVNPFAGAPVPLPTVVISSASYLKTDDGVAEYSGFEEAALAVQGVETELQFDVGIAVQPTIDGAAIVDDAPLSVSDPTITLAFNLDNTSAIPTARTDDCVATLEMNASGTLTPMRRYQVLDFPASIVVDTAQFTNATSYVFRIQCRRGYPLARTLGDYRTVDYPFEIGVAFTPTFVAMK